MKTFVIGSLISLTPLLLQQDKQGSQMYVNLIIFILIKFIFHLNFSKDVLTLAEQQNPRMIHLEKKPF